MRNNESLNLPPSPASLVESLRDIGYSMRTAIADIVDNSITAEAKAISIRCSWNGGDPWLAVVDNGYGMSRQELIRAMRFGSTSPLQERRPEDLGRFGLGLKTASFSQCRHLTVLSKHKENLSCFEWDLEKIASEGEYEWRLGVIDVQELEQDSTLLGLNEEYLSGGDSGTIVLWRKLDRIAKGEANSTRETVFNSLVDEVRDHLQQVFHRFLVGSTKGTKIQISVNGDPLDAFDPFNPTHPATQELAEQRISFDGHDIVVQPFILPHHNKVSKEEWIRYGGIGGYLHNQGFYVYRNRRLIIWGTWFRLIKKQELTKLIRIRVDIPNALDHLWNIDVKKSHASPPESVRRELRQVIERIEDSGKKVYRQRGQRLRTEAAIPAWNRVAKSGSVHYEINRKHPLISRLIKNGSVEDHELVRDMLQLIESDFPQELYYNDIATRPEEVQKPAVDESILDEMLGRFLSFYAPNSKLDKESIDRLLTIEPFASRQDLTRDLLSKKGIKT